MWDDALRERNIDIVIGTHRVLPDALIRGFLQMDKIALLVFFDEDHHCARWPSCK